MSSVKTNSTIKIFLMHIMCGFRYLDVLQIPSRVARTKYFIIPPLYLCLLLPIIFVAAISFKSSQITFVISALLAIIIAIVSIISEIVLKIKRLHDLDCNGWWLLLALVPLLNIAFELALYFTKGTEGKNRFGAETKKSTKLEYILTIIFIPIRASLFAMFIFYKTIGA
jgi:uncharacterized membrane protein YhaH (DUF805 family)